MLRTLFPYLVLARPANIVTAVADILAGVAIVGFFNKDDWHLYWPSLTFLVISTACLYGGGIVFNDIFDYELDKKERPERPLPSGLISAKQAIQFGTALISIGIVSAFLVNSSSGYVAISIATLALLYDYAGKHHAFWGPLNMGFCRGLNLLLGMTILPSVFQSNLPMLSLLPVVFVAAITLTSRGEVRGNNRGSIIFALALDVLIAATVIILGFVETLNLWYVLPFITLWLGMNILAKMRAILINEPDSIMRAVKTGVISLIPLNASYAAGFGHWSIGLVMLILLPLTFLMARKFAVT